MKRKAISPKTRFDIFKRDSFTCQYCGATPPSAILHVDHVLPVVNGGENGDDNLVTACSNCNQGKGARSLELVPKSLQEKAGEVAEREAQLKGYSKILEAKRKRIENDVWKIVDALNGAPTTQYDRRNLASIRKFIEKLPFHSVLEAAEISSSRFTGYKGFRYFCGICWNKVRGE